MFTTQSNPNLSVVSDLDLTSLVSGLLADPQTGVSIVRLSGSLLYANAQAAELFLGDASRAPQLAGSSLWSLFPDKWVGELADFAAQVVRSGEPAMIRTVWRGRQVLSWVSPLDADTPPSEVRLLVVSRFSPGAMGGEDDAPRFTVFESGFVSLGELDILSPRELEVLALVGQGLSIKEIAGILHRSEKTIQNHRDSIGSKLGLANRVHVAAVAQRAGLTRQDAERIRVRVDGQRANGR